MRVAIFGSCVSRDSVACFGDEVEFIGYVARSSIVSACHSTPYSISDAEIAEIEASNFEKRMIAHDVKKTGVSHLCSLNARVIVVDLIDERFQVYGDGNSLITLSANIAKSQTGRLVRKSAKPLRNDSGFENLFDEQAHQFIDKLESSGAVVILHEAYWANSIADGDSLKPFDELAAIDAQNERLEKYYSSFKKRIDYSKVIRLDELRISSNSHKWGLAPIHFVDEYYAELSRKVTSICDTL